MHKELNEYLYRIRKIIFGFEKILDFVKTEDFKYSKITNIRFNLLKLKNSRIFRLQKLTCIFIGFKTTSAIRISEKFGNLKNFSE